MEAALAGQYAAPARRDWRRDYARALGDYLKNGGEARLEEAFELGRYALISGSGILNLTRLHHDAVAAEARAELPGDDASAMIETAGEFFAESMAPFEMTHRAIGDANQALRKLNDTLEEEMRRVALALHDDAGQLMAAVHLSLDEATRDLPPAARARMNGVRDLLASVEERIRDLSHELRPAMLDQLGLGPAVEFLAASIGRRSGLRIAVDSPRGLRLAPDIAIALYRAIQEALTNVRRHAQATRARVHISLRGNSVRCVVSDNGVGFDAARASAQPGLGLIGIRERLHALGGKLRIQSAEGRGTKLEISAPLPEEDHADSDTSRGRPSSST